MAVSGCLTLDNVLLRPWPGPNRTPADLGAEYEDVFVASAGGAKVHGWFVPIDGAIGSLIIHPGIEGNVERYLPAVSMGRDWGLNVLVYDFQGFGRSEGAKRLASFESDGVAMMDWLIVRPIDERGPIVQMGVSFGTQVAIAVALRRPDDTAGVVLEGTITPATLASQWMELRFDELGLQLGAIGDWWITPQLPPEMDATRSIGRLTIPKLFVHSPDDAIAPWTGALLLYDLAPEPKWFFATVGSHAEGHKLDPHYRPTIQRFLDHCFGIGDGLVPDGH